MSKYLWQILGAQKILMASISNFNYKHPLKRACVVASRCCFEKNLSSKLWKVKEQEPWGGNVPMSDFLGKVYLLEEDASYY